MGQQEKGVELEAAAPEWMDTEGFPSEDAACSPPQPALSGGNTTSVSYSEVWRQTRTATASTAGSQTWEEHGSILLSLEPSNQFSQLAALVKTSPSRIDSSVSLDTPREGQRTLDDEKLKGLRKPFHPRKQLRRLLLHGLIRWSMTAILVLCLYLTLWHYSSKEVMSHTGKLQFNALVTGISIALGLNIASSLREMALETRWWILSRRKRSLHEVDLILNSDSPYHLFMLVMTSPRVNVILVVLLWLLLNLGAQLGVALLGLAYSVDSAGTFALTVHGNVSIPDMSSLATTNVISAPQSAAEDDRALRYTANSFGVVALALGSDYISAKPKPRTLFSSDYPIIFVGDDYTQYVFYDASPDGSISVATDRTINATGLCNSWPVVDGGDGSKSNITIMLSSLSVKTNVHIPITAGLNQTTYVTHLSRSCGDGCGIITALETSLENPFYYECNITVTKVDNAERPEHEVVSSLRTLAASAIALQGYVAPSVNNNTDLQFQTYPAEFAYGAAQNGSTHAMGLQISAFSMGVIAVAAQNNPQIMVPGDQPQAGLTLNIAQWKYVHLILGLTAGLQLVLVIITALVSNRAIVKDKSHLAVARLLSPFVEQLGSSGSIATGKEISDAFGSEAKFIYSVDRTSQSDLLRLSMGQQKPVRRFPKGLYD